MEIITKNVTEINLREYIQKDYAYDGAVEPTENVECDLSRGAFAWKVAENKVTFLTCNQFYFTAVLPWRKVKISYPRLVYVTFQYTNKQCRAHRTPPERHKHHVTLYTR